jgi:NADP-dependent 3-hydroxy acid dehydrogenase YdfG
MYRTILMTGSGFGEGTAIGLAQRGHTVIAATQSWSRRCATRPTLSGYAVCASKSPICWNPTTLLV